jgi:hypothetical protein
MGNALVWQYSCNTPIGFSDSAGSEDSGAGAGAVRSPQHQFAPDEGDRTGRNAKNRNRPESWVSSSDDVLEPALYWSVERFILSQKYMFLDPKVMAAVEQLNYRVTVGDVAVKSGLELQVAQQGLMTLASEAGGHLQVTETGEVAYLFSQNFRSVLQAKFLKLRLLAWWQQIWKGLFYLIRISFGILLVVSICIIAIAIFAIILSSTLSNKDSENSDSGNDVSFGGFPIGWIFTDWYYFFLPNPYSSSQSTPTSPSKKESMNFLEAVFSFLFGDGNPNHNLEGQRWQEIGKVLRQNDGAIVAEQVIPFLEQPSEEQSVDDAMLPVLLRFNGQPEVSPEGGIVYHFPDLQTSVESDRSAPVAPFLQESLWKFSHASSGQILGAIGLGSANFIGAIILGKLLSGITAMGFLGLVQAIYGVLLAYGIGFLTIPLGRYFWVQWQNQRIAARNQTRSHSAELLYEPSQAITQKLSFARQFARSTLVDDLDLVYTTEKDILEQESENQAKIDADWEKRLGQSTQENK